MAHVLRPTMTDEEGDAVAAMAQYGGSFARALAVAYQRADPVNRARIREGFSDLFREYAEVARTAAREREA
jgi:hypothetical protein